MHLAGRVRNQAPVLRLVGVGVESLFKPQPKLARGGFAIRIKCAVIGHPVYKEQAQHLDAQGLQILQLGKVRGHGALNLVAHHGVGQAALLFVQHQHPPA